MWDALHASMLRWYRLIGRGSDGASTFERDGLVAALVPASPQRSVVNAVVYERPDALVVAYDEIAAAYAEIGAKWTVWVHNGDLATAAVLESMGHVLDASPEAMAADLVATPPARPPADALEDWTDAGDLADVGPINEARGEGISGKLIAHGLADAVERGARTSTLVATKLGRPVYERLGFRSLGALEMWERRVDER
jgi:predicted GNAT family N-acyltransferase